MKIKIFAILTLASGLAIMSCSGGSKSSSSDTTSPTITGAFSTFLAEDLAVSSPTANRTSATPMKLQSAPGNSAMSIPEGGAPAADKVAAVNTLLEASGSCAIAINLASSGNANCYGPSVNFANHEADSSSGSFPGGDLGIWEENQGAGQACSAAQLNGRIAGVASMSDLGTFLVAGMACAAKKANLSAPAENASLDLTSALAGLVTIDGNPVTVTSAGLFRNSNDSSGNPVRVATLSGTAGTKSYFIRLKHVSLDATDSTYRGKISVSIGVADGNRPMNCGSSSATGSTDALSVSYEKTSASAAKFELKSANFCGSDANPFKSVTNYTVDLSNVMLMPSSPKGWANNANYMIASFDPTTQVGTYSYAWLAGAGDSHSRTFNAKINSGSPVTATAYFGFGPSITSGTGGSISGMICAWTGPGSDHTQIQTRAQKQTMSLDSATGKFTSTGVNITYDPVLDCEAAGSMSLTWNSGANSRAVSATTMDLVDVTEVSTTMGSLPTAPADVD